MAKKTFKDNPALQFISQPEPAADPTPEEIAKKLGVPEGYRINPRYIEKKSRRLQLVFQPSLYERVKAAADAAGLSVNEYIHEVLDKATREEH